MRRWCTAVVFLILQDVLVCDGRYIQDVIARSKRATKMTFTEQKLVIDKHNTLRRQEGASNMELMTWNSFLADMAQDWADSCKWYHGQPFRSLQPYDPVGQNLYYIAGGSLSVEAGIQAWYNEKKDYKYDTGVCLDVCGHYTQVVWASSKVVGCAYASCAEMKEKDGTTVVSNAHYLVCNYGPAGNMQGQKPFKKGNACSMCGDGKGWCDTGLCNGACTNIGDGCDCNLECHNCGSLNNDCSCTCPAGWWATDCTEECKDLNSNCNKNPGLPQITCTMKGFEFVKDQCPAMCGRCIKGNGTVPSCTKTTEPITSSMAITTKSQTTTNVPNTTMQESIVSTQTTLNMPTTTVTVKTTTLPLTTMTPSKPTSDPKMITGTITSDNANVPNSTFQVTSAEHVTTTDGATTQISSNTNKKTTSVVQTSSATKVPIAVTMTKQTTTVVNKASTGNTAESSITDLVNVTSKTGSITTLKMLIDTSTSTYKITQSTSPDHTTKQTDTTVKELTATPKIMHSEKIDNQQSTKAISAEPSTRATSPATILSSDLSTTTLAPTTATTEVPVVLTTNLASTIATTVSSSAGTSTSIYKITQRTTASAPGDATKQTDTTLKGLTSTPNMIHSEHTDNQQPTRATSVAPSITSTSHDTIVSDSSTTTLASTVGTTVSSSATEPGTTVTATEPTTTNAYTTAESTDVDAVSTTQATECATHRCKNGGTPSKKGRKCRCACPSGWQGNQCELSESESYNGVLVHIISYISVWNLIVDMVMSLAAEAVNQYCNDNVNICCPNLSTIKSKVYQKFVHASDLRVGSGYPVEAHMRTGLLTTALLLVEAPSDNPLCSSSVTKSKRETNTIHLTVVLNQKVFLDILRQIEGNLTQTLLECCNATVTAVLLPEPLTTINTINATADTSTTQLRVTSTHVTPSSASLMVFPVWAYGVIGLAVFAAFMSLSLFILFYRKWSHLLKSKYRSRKQKRLKSKHRKPKKSRPNPDVFIDDWYKVKGRMDIQNARTANPVNYMGDHKDSFVFYDGYNYYWK